MEKKPIKLLVFALTYLITSTLFVGGSFAEPSPAQSAHLLRGGGSESYEIKAGDKIAVTIYPIDESIKGGEMEVSSEGNITIPVVGKVEIGGLNVIEAERKLAAILEADYFVDPEVVIEVLEFKDLKVVLLGQVRKPGTYSFPPAENEFTLLEAIALAGGFTEIANIKKIKIMRSVEGSEKNEKMRANADKIIQGEEPDVRLQEGDIVHVPESLF